MNSQTKLQATLLAALLGTAALAPAMAQTTDVDTTVDDRVVMVDDDDDRGFDDWGLLGLLGLLGLMPKKRQDVVVRDTVRPTNPNDPTNPNNRM